MYAHPRAPAKPHHIAGPKNDVLFTTTFFFFFPLPFWCFSGTFCTAACWCLDESIWSFIGQSARQPLLITMSKLVNFTLFKTATFVVCPPHTQIPLACLSPLPLSPARSVREHVGGVRDCVGCRYQVSTGGGQLSSPIFTGGDQQAYPIFPSLCLFPGLKHPLPRHFSSLRRHVLSLEL